MGKYDWMFDVLSDIEAYSRKNDLPQIAEEVEKARLIAAKELTDRRNVSVTETDRPSSLFRAQFTQ